jgi:MFS family permease
VVGATGYWLELAGNSNAANFAMIGAFMLSIAAVFEALAKFSTGFIIDRWGSGVGTALFLLLPAVGMLIWILVPASLPSLYIGAALFGTVTAGILVGKPLVLRALFGERTYPLVQSYTGALNTALSGLGAPLIAMVILSFNYSAAFVVGIIACIVAALFFFLPARYEASLKAKWVDADGNPMPNA